MSAEYLLFLDFDGVICDSIEECLAASWLGFYKYYKQQTPDFIPVEYKKQFLDFRPFIRSGEDYLLIHQLLSLGKKVGCQEEFDQLIKETGLKKMTDFKEYFYMGRNFLIKDDFEYWCRINPLYHHMIPLLKNYIQNEHLFILSTKKPEFIAAILEYNHMSISESRIIYSGSQIKYRFIESVMGAYNNPRSVFVDDQIDHLVQPHHFMITPYLASWGYIKPEWLSGTVGILHPDDIKSIFLDL